MRGSDLTRPDTLAFRGKRGNNSKVGGFVNQVAFVEIWLLLSKFGLIFTVTLKLVHKYPMSVISKGEHLNPVI
jgi:hypothetical protein